MAVLTNHGQNAPFPNNREKNQIFYRLRLLYRGSFFIVVVEINHLELILLYNLYLYTKNRVDGQ